MEKTPSKYSITLNVSKLNSIFNEFGQYTNFLLTRHCLLLQIALFCWEIFLLREIIARMSYVEIDFTTYLEQAQHYFVDGTTKYSQIKGESGPIAYPAGHIYVFEVIRRFCVVNGFVLIRRAQMLFASIYLYQLAVIFAIYRKCKLPPLAFVLATLSRRLHSIFVLRMFNDCIAVPLVFTFLLLLVHKRQSLSYVFYAMALSVKMNVLLIYPAVALYTFHQRNVIKFHSILLVVLLLLSLPFLMDSPMEYLQMAFNFGRRFEWEWTVNWRFLGPKCFRLLQEHHLTLSLHVISLLFWIKYRWNTFKNSRDPEVLCRNVFECNLLGMIFSKSLHYQFLSSYSMTIPFLLLNGKRVGSIIDCLIYIAIDQCWKIFPSTWWSSLSLLTLNIYLLYQSLRRKTYIDQ